MIPLAGAYLTVALFAFLCAADDLRGCGREGVIVAGAFGLLWLPVLATVAGVLGVSRWQNWRGAR